MPPLEPPQSGGHVGATGPHGSQRIGVGEGVGPGCRWKMEGLDPATSKSSGLLARHWSHHTVLGQGRGLDLTAGGT
jgi:hypothetical protein